MKTFAFSLAYALFRTYITPRVFDKVSALVIALVEEDIPGSAKKAKVVDFVLTYAEELSKRFGGSWEIMLDGIIFFARAKFGEMAKE